MNSTTSTTPRHPIRVVARRTGLTPATLRAWERRYGVVEPGRSDGGQRLYSDQDIERLSRLRALTELGRPIGLVAGLSEGEAAALLEEDRAATGEAATSRRRLTDGDAPAAWVDEAYRAIGAMDGARLHAILRRSAAVLGAVRFLADVAEPLLQRVGSRWATGEITPAHEHLASGVLEQVLTWLMPPSSSDHDLSRVVVATLAGERHGLGARLVAAAATTEGWGVVYLGTDLPATDIATAAREVGAAIVSISVVLTDRAAESVDELTRLRSLLPSDVELVVGGRGARTLPTDRLPGGVEVAAGLDAFRSLLRERSAGDM